MSTEKAVVKKVEASLKLVAHFLGKIERRDVPEWDPMGIETLDFLIEALNVIDTKTETWTAVTTYILKKANDEVRSRVYTGTLRTLSSHTSTEVTEQIVSHLTAHGEVNAVLDITINKLQRFPFPDEIALMVTYHHQKHTSSKSNVWKALLAAAGEEGEHAIGQVLCELRVIENDFIIT